MTTSAARGFEGLTAMEPHHELDPLQWGHVRHVVRLSRQIPGDWSDMGPFDPTNEGDDAYRYQLAYMAYGLALVQYHYLPAYRELLQGTFASLVSKMLRHDVWGYWELTSRGSKVMDPDLEALGDGWIDPVIRKNVMYSGHLLMMASLYEMLYRDGRYFEPGSLTFECRPPFRGMGPEDFPYDLGSLAGVIAEQFAATGGLGCECEPNGIFVYCNQFPMLGLRHLDHIRGTDIAGPIMKAFRAAWGSRSTLFTDTARDLPVFLMVRQDEVVTEGAEENNEAASMVSWGPFMHTWQKEYVEAIYPRVMHDIRTETAWGFSVGLERFHRTHLDYQARPSIDLVDPMMLGVHTHGMLALLASEMGDAETRDGLLAHSDAVMRPTWKDGGLFYPRCDELDTERYVTCVTGNALLGAARVNVKDGIHALYTAPWTERELSSPLLVGVDFPRVLVTSARFYDDAGVLRATLLPGDDATGEASFSITGMRERLPLAVEVDGVEIGSVSSTGEASGAGIAWDAAAGLLHLRIPLQAATRIAVHAH